MAKKRADHEEHEEHVDERWLVSYADMMTLLFGLFVILFSIASEKQGNFNENLRSISDSATLTETKPEEVVPEKPEEIPDVRPELEQKKREVAELLEQNRLAAIKAAEDLAELQKLREMIARLELDQKQILTEAEQKLKTIEELKQENSQAKNLKDQDKNALQNTTEALKDLKAKNEKLKDEMKELLAKNEQLQKTLAKMPDKNKIERSISSLQENDATNKKVIEDLTRKIVDTEAKNKRLQEDLKDFEKKNNDSRTYLFVLFKWSTEKHDLDLTVKDPNGNLFSFKKKAYSGAQGLFALDSRSGPGAEIWQSNDPTPGRYSVKVKMYNNYGNLEPAVLSGSILSNKSSIVVTDKKVESKGGSEMQFTFEVDEKGFVKML